MMTDSVVSAADFRQPEMLFIIHNNNTFSSLCTLCLVNTDSSGTTLSFLGLDMYWGLYRYLFESVKTSENDISADINLLYTNYKRKIFDKVPLNNAFLKTIVTNDCTGQDIFQLKYSKTYL